MFSNIFSVVMPSFHNIFSIYRRTVHGVVKNEGDNPNIDFLYPVIKLYTMRLDHVKIRKRQSQVEDLKRRIHLNIIIP